MSFSGENSALFDDDDYLGYDARIQSQRFDPLAKFGELDSVADDGVFVEESVMDTKVRVYCSGDVIGLNSTPKLNEEEDMAVRIGGSDFPVLEEVVDEKGFALREWRRLNVIRLAEKDKLEKEVRTETILEAEEFKVDFYKRRQVTVENKKVSNREKQKIFLENHEKFHKEAVTNYWKAILELVTNEVPAIERRGEKDKDKKPSITVIQGPKPGKPTDLSRMRQILSKLRHHTPLHLVPTPSSSSPDAKTDSLALHAAPSQPMAAA